MKEKPPDDATNDENRRCDQPYDGQNGPSSNLLELVDGGHRRCSAMTLPVTSRAAKAIIQPRFCSRFVNISQFLPQGLWFSP
jgi:hypothetical protein